MGKAVFNVIPAFPLQGIMMRPLISLGIKKIIIWLQDKIDLQAKPTYLNRLIRTCISHKIFKRSEPTWQSSMIAWREQRAKKPVILQHFKRTWTKNHLIWFINRAIIQKTDTGKNGTVQNNNTWFWSESHVENRTRNLTPKHRPYLGHKLRFFTIFGSFLDEIKQIRTTNWFSWLS